jgi:hypothetical protein
MARGAFRSEGRLLLPRPQGADVLRQLLDHIPDLTGADVPFQGLKHSACCILGVDWRRGEGVYSRARNSSRERIFRGFPAGCHAS